MVLLLKKHLPVLLLSVILVGLSVAASDTAYLTIEMTSREQNFIQIFWAGEDGQYSTQRTSTLVSEKGHNGYSFPLHDALLIKKVRVDLQQGKGDIPPAPVEVHAIGYSFKWLFRGRHFAGNIDDLDAVKGTAAAKIGDNAEKMIFTDADPQLEFDLKIRPIAYQFFLPICFFLSMHFLLSRYLLKGKKGRYFLDMVIGGDYQKVLNAFLEVLQRKRISYRILQSSLAGDTMQVLFQIDIQSAELLRTLLQDAAVKNHLRSVRCDATRSGEIL